jgi:predicted nucleic acid-binding protein
MILTLPAVQKELLAWHESVPAWIEVIATRGLSRVERFRRDIHISEAEAIALGLELDADWVLVGDAESRRLARNEGGQVLELMGVLLLAKKRRGHLAEVLPLVDEFETAGFFLSQRSRSEVLRLAGENP